MKRLQVLGILILFPLATQGQEELVGVWDGSTELPGGVLLEQFIFNNDGTYSLQQEYEGSLDALFEVLGFTTDGHELGEGTVSSLVTGTWNINEDGRLDGSEISIEVDFAGDDFPPEFLDQGVESITAYLRVTGVPNDSSLSITGTTLQFGSNPTGYVKQPSSTAVGVESWGQIKIKARL